MERPLLEAQLRKATRKNALKEVRREGFIPAVIYGRNKESVHVKIQKSDLEKALRQFSIGASVDIKVENTVIPVIIKDIQKHTTKLNILHMDLQELDKNQKVKVKIPIYLTGKGAVESSTAVIQQQTTELEIQTFPQYLRKSIEVDVSNMKFGEPFMIKELEIFKDEHIDVLNDPEEVIALLTSSSKIEVKEEEDEDDLLRRLY